MRRISLTTKVLLAVLLTASLCLPLAAQQITFPQASPKASITQTVGMTEFTVTYFRPGVKGREIWGGLVPYDKVWRTGANEATVISFNDPVLVEGKKLEAGKYSIFTIPGQSQWTVIFNKNTALWGDYGYKAEEDVLRVTVGSAPGEMVERMQFVFRDVTDSGAVLELQWEKLRVGVKLEVDTQAKIRAITAQTPLRAASYLFNNNGDLQEALKYVNSSLAIQEGYQGLFLKGRILEKMGNAAEATATLQKALTAGKGMTPPPQSLSMVEELLKKLTGK